MRMNVLLMAFLLLFPGIAHAGREVISKVGEREGGPERLVNSGFEAGPDKAADAWYGWGHGYEPSAYAGRNNSRGVRCAATDPGEQHGASQPIRFDPPVSTPMRITGWSRAEAVDGAADNGYAIYLDITYHDGDHLWALTSCFSVGTHDWEQRKLVYAPPKPVKEITLHALFRGHNGIAYFDDFSLTLLEETHLFEGVPVMPRNHVQAAGDLLSLGAENGLQCYLDANTGAAYSLRLNGRVLGENGLPPFVRDVAADSGFFAPDSWRIAPEHASISLSGEVSSLAVRVTVSMAAKDGLLDITGRIEDLRAEDRALTLYVPFPLQGDWRWAQDIRRGIPARGTCINAFHTAAGATGMRSSYPLAALTGPKGGIAIAVPLHEPRHHRLVYDAEQGLLYAAFDFGLTPDVRRSPGVATFHVLAYSFDPAWHFRAAWAR